VRKVDTTLLDLKACQAQDGLGKQLLQNCVAQRDSLASIVSERGQQLDSFKTALKAQQDLAGTEKAQLERQLQTAQGGRLQRIWNAVKFPAGLAIGGIVVWAVKQ
jgi:hypothetical protein